MKVQPLNKYFKKNVRMPQYKNILEALHLSNIIRKLSGISIFLIMVTRDNRIVRQFTLLGFMCCLLWNCLFFYCTYKAHDEDQTILRNIYGTKVRRYGDDFERVSSTAYVLFSMWKIPYSLNSNIRFIEIIVNVDKALENIGEIVDYSRDAHLALYMSICQVVVFLVRLLSIWITLNHLDMPIPIERMYQVVYSDALAVITTAHFCYFLIVVRGRFKNMNKVLDEIKSRKSWEYKLFVRGQLAANVHKATDLQDRYICEKIKTCAKIYGMLYEVADATNKMFGAVLMLTVFVSMCYIILYMFYFMEATAAGLFNDVNKYMVFLIHVFWQIGYGMVIIFVIVYVCERAVYEAQNTSFIIHEIINSDFSPAVKTEAMQLSIQSLHQKPVFSANGLYELNYALLHQLSRSVTTYLVMLLQFVTDAN